MKRILTSESVNIGHPDKTCDVIADAFLDAALKKDPSSQMAVECAIKNNKLFIYGEATTKAKINYEQIAREVLKDIGYKVDFEIVKELSVQSPEISKAVVKKKLAANDQGIVFGYATNESEQFMPLPILIAHELMREYENFRRKGSEFFADAKAQVSVEYEDSVPQKIHTILMSVSHSENVKNLKEQITKFVLQPVLARHAPLDKGDINIILQPSGSFTVWGSFSDSGCVGRKIVVDAYGGAAKVGGGCFSSKNATKVDRSGAYYARYVAKNLVANGLCDRCEIEVSYGIGLENALTVNMETFGTEKMPLQEIEKIVRQNFDFSPDNIIKELGLLKPIYKQTACYGHFGNPDYPWEKIKPLCLHLK